MTASTPQPLVGARVERSPDCLEWLHWVLGKRSAPPRETSVQWLLAHCLDGVTWGRFDGTQWKLGSQPFPELCPQISEDNLLELRLFGEHEELLVWRDDGVLCGRWLLDSAYDPDSPAKPSNEERILIGNELIKEENGFWHVKDRSGRQQAVPLKDQPKFGIEPKRAMPLRLNVLHYFEQCSRTGAVRVAASRLKSVTVQSRTDEVLS